VESETVSSQCPCCGFASIYTDGTNPCSVSCAVGKAYELATEHGVPTDVAAKVAADEAKEQGLPEAPNSRDVNENKYRYVVVREEKLSRYWNIDRELLAAGFNVEYIWVVQDVAGFRSRVYRFAPSLMPLLPEVMLDFKSKKFDNSTLRGWAGGFPYWHFLPSQI